MHSLVLTHTHTHTHKHTHMHTQTQRERERERERNTKYLSVYLRTDDNRSYTIHRVRGRVKSATSLGMFKSLLKTHLSSE